MNKIAKPLVVFVAAGSLGFLAFVISLVHGGPNWDAILQSPEFTNDFVYSTTPGERVTHVVKHRRSDQQISSSVVLPEAIVAARQKQVQELRAELTQLQQDNERRRPQVAEAQRHLALDQQALKARSDRLAEEIAAIQKTEADLLALQAAKAAEAQQVFKVAEERRNEGFRLKNVLELARNDAYVNEVQKAALADELVRLEENVRRLSRRNEQLKSELNASNSQAPATTATNTP